MKKTLLLTLATMLATTLSAQKYVGGDISLVPAYETAGDKWLDADGNAINTTYSDGMITYLRDVAKWNAIRVRLLVNPANDDGVVDDDYMATCQDIDYVKKLGKRIKDAGMSFLLDIFYSDTWTDVSKQWIPGDWGYDSTTAIETLAAKVKSYTTEVLDALTDYGAKPDFIQLGNEVSYGMLWDNLTGKNESKWFVTSSTYNAQEANIKRFAALLKAAKEGVDASKAAGASIILHCERTETAAHCVNFYNWVTQAGFTDFDIIGLSYYPLWHGTLTNLSSTLTQLQTYFPSKKIQIVETGYQHTTPSSIKSSEYNTSSTWPYSTTGQTSFVKDLISTLNNFDNVTGLYYWQPEECGNGADANGNNRVMNHYDNRGFWNNTWKSGSHTLNSKDALMALKTFIGEEDDPTQETDVTNQYIVNPSFTNDISGWTNTGGTAQWKQNTWAPLSNFCEFAWTGNAIVDQKVVQTPTLPAGSYELTINCASNKNSTGVFLIAGNQSVEMKGTGNVETSSVSFTVTSETAIEIGIKLQNTTATWVNFDNFVLILKTTSGIEAITTCTQSNNNAWYTPDGRRLTAEPTQKGLYIHNGKKIIVK